MSFLKLLEFALCANLSLDKDNCVQFDGFRRCCDRDRNAQISVSTILQSPREVRVDVWENERDTTFNWGAYRDKGRNHRLYLNTFELTHKKRGQAHLEAFLMHELSEAYFGEVMGLQGYSGYEQAHEYANHVQEKVYADRGIEMVPTGPLGSTRVVDNGKTFVIVTVPGTGPILWNNRPAICGITVDVVRVPVK